MKKLLSICLVLALALSLSVTAFAAGPYDAPGASESYNVEADYTKPVDVVPTVYHVTIEWTASGTISYTDKQMTYNWNTSDLKYSSQTSAEAAWTVENAAVAITVKNRSNAGITAACGNPVVATGITNITGTYDNANLNIASAAPDDHTSEEMGTEQSATATYTITGVEGAISEDGVIGTITVSLGAAT